VVSSRSRKKEEEQNQVAFFDWAELAKQAIPELASLFHVPNGKASPSKFRIGRDGKKVWFSLEGQRMKRMGLKRGVPDVWLPCPRVYKDAGRAGIVIEFKSPEGDTDKEQKKFLDFLCDEGWVVVVARDWTYARDIVVEYLTGEHSSAYGIKWIQ